MTAQTKIMELEQVEIANVPDITSTEIEQAFQGATDFRDVGERITKPLEDIIEKTMVVIDNDPIMGVDKELSTVNNEVQNVYGEIMNTDGSVMKFLKGLPGVGGIVGKLDSKFDEAAFNMKGIQGKIEVIFSGFDQSYESVNKSIDLQMDFLEGIDANLGKIIDYRNYIDQKINEFNQRIEETTDEKEKEKYKLFINNVVFFQNNLDVLIGNLDLSRKRLLMRLDSAQKLGLAMQSSRPIFKVLLSTALIESSSQKAIDASMAAMNIMGQTIDKMSSDLTDKAIEGNRRAEELSSKPVLSTEVFVKNVEKLKVHFDQIDEIRHNISLKSQAEMKAFNEAQQKLNNFGILDQEQINELEGELNYIEQAAEQQYQEIQQDYQNEFQAMENER